MRSFISVNTFLMLFCSVVFLCACSEKETLYYSAPNVLDNVSGEMQRPGFWIANHPEPNKLILNQSGIERLNIHIRDELAMVSDIESFPEYHDGEKLKAELLDRFERIRGRDLFFKDSILVSDSFFESLLKNMGLESLSTSLPVQFGLIVGYSNQRRLPTTKLLFSEKGSSYFDSIQNSGLDVGTPVAIVHTSVDGNWYYGVTPGSAGWVRAESVALCGRQTLGEYLNESSFVIVTEAKSDIFLDISQHHFHQSARMGTRLPLIHFFEGEVVEVKIPFRSNNGKLVFHSGFIKSSKLNQGYLPYTPRNIINQAFELLHEPYGWGGMKGNQDCSRFIKEIFATVGIHLPRNSRGQAEVGRVIYEKGSDKGVSKKVGALHGQGIGGTGLIFTPGHVMLFLGMIDEHKYVIHSTWGYRQKTIWGDRIRLLNRVVVSDLSLGSGSKRGSLLERITIMNQITNQ